MHPIDGHEPEGSARRALIIAHEPDGPGGQVAVRLAARGYGVETHVVTHDVDAPNTSTPFPAIEPYDVVAIMGSVRSLTEKDEISNWVLEELELIRHAHRIEKPLLGVCFGGQLVADALGGSVETSPTTEIGWFMIEAADGKTNPVGPGPWMEWHHDRFSPPPGAEVLAKTDAATQLFTIGRIVVTQFHPEIDLAHLIGWLKTADDEYLNTYGQNRETLIADMREHETHNIEQCHALVDWFLDDIAFPETEAPVAAGLTQAVTP